MKETPTIALCIMSPGETPGLHRAVESAYGLYDELCWLDTAQHVPFDFGRARSENLAMATADWILVLDDDEHVASSMFTALRHVLTTTGHDALRVQMIDTLEGGAVEHPYRQQRLFRRGCVAFSGSVHHRAAVTGTTGDCSLVIKHSGYDLTPEEQRRKYTPRLEAYAAEVRGATAEEEPQRQYQYAEALYMTGHYRDAFAAFRTALWCLEPFREAESYAYLVRCLLKTVEAEPLIPREAALHIARRAVLYAMTEPLGRMHAGALLHALGAHGEGLTHIREALGWARLGVGTTYRVAPEMIAAALEQLEALTPDPLEAVA